MREYRTSEPRGKGLPDLEITHVGFDKKLAGAQHIILVRREDIVEAFAVDDPKNLKSLIGYLNNVGPYKLLDTYTRDKK